MMNIGEAAKASGVSAKMIRYYESIGLIPKPGRSQAGYRLYSPADVNTLRFIRRARSFGFPIERVRHLVGLWQERRPSSAVKKLALAQVNELSERIAELTAMRGALQHLADCCHGDDRPECPIIEELEGVEGADAVPRHTAPRSAAHHAHR
jgi:MerR family copper efflux transcriptional regulator